MEHQSLCSANGMPHSMQTRMRGLGGSRRPNSRFHSDMFPPTKRQRARERAERAGAMIVDTLDEPNWFQVGSHGVEMSGGRAGAHGSSPSQSRHACHPHNRSLHKHSHAEELTAAGGQVRLVNEVRD
jgi:hypothetical protein